MELIHHTLDWVKGEILEAKIMAIAGVVIVLCAISFWKFGTTPYAKAMVIPMLVVGIIPLIFGISGAVSNQRNISHYQEAWEKNQQTFVISEKERVEGFDNIFKYSYPFAIICTIGGAILFFLVSTPNWKAISLALMMLGLMAYIIDHFAAERADIYLKYIKEAIK
ncbi:hypothetical protein BKI52_09265 [marine bacterium AO1-C]|nr:hypothetical protein BKI52_09265 [marine bacterium AO1-C]